MAKYIDLEMLSVDLAEVLSGDEYGIDVDCNDVRRGLVPFLDSIAPGLLSDLTAGQRFGVTGG